MTIYDIARLAGVSIATVSRVVNDSPKVSPKTKEAVLRVMEEQNYAPNMFARGLGSGSARTVGILCPDVSDNYMASAVSTLEKKLRENAYDCILCCSGYDQNSIHASLVLMLHKQIDALILVGSIYSDENELVRSPILEVSSRFPVFLLNGKISGEQIFSILADDYRSVYDAVEELLLSGRKRILFLTDSRSYSARKKRKGYEDALLHHGIDPDAALILFGTNSIIETRDLLLRQRELHFDGVLATEDGMAVGAVKYAKLTGLRVPEEVSIIGYNNSELAVSCEPELTSVDNRVELLSRAAVESFLSIQSGTKPDSVQVVKSHLIKRGTTDF